MSDKESEEYRSFNAAKKKLHFLKALTDISQPNQEGLDFVFVSTEDIGSVLNIFVSIFLWGVAKILALK